MINYLRLLKQKELLEILYIYEHDVNFNINRYKDYKDIESFDSIFITGDFVWFHNPEYSFPFFAPKIESIIKNRNRNIKLKNILDEKY